MNENIIITEGQFDAELLQKVLPDEIVENSRFIPSTGYSSAVSKAKSIAIRLKQRVFLVLDSDTAEHNEAEEKKEQIEYIFRSLGKSDQVNVFLFEPETEVIFFESEKVREKLIGMSPRTNSFYPRQIIGSIGNKSQLIDKLDNKDIESLRKETSLKEMIRLCSENTDSFIIHNMMCNPASFSESQQKKGEQWK